MLSSLYSREVLTANVPSLLTKYDKILEVTVHAEWALQCEFDVEFSISVKMTNGNLSERIPPRIMGLLGV